MIDYVNVRITTPHRLPKFEALGWNYEAKYTKAPKELRQLRYHLWEHRGIEVRHYVERDTWYLQGSLHKFANHGRHNYDDFTYLRLYDTIAKLVQVLNLDVYSCELNGIEFAVNFHFDGRRFTRGLLFHHGIPFERNKVKDGGTCFECEHSDYRLKGYDKAAQNKIKHAIGITRWEFKTRKMRCIEGAGITSLGDLLDTDNLMRLKGILLDQWNRVLFYDDTISKKGLRPLQRSKLKDYRNRDYWSELDKDARMKQKRYYLELVSEHSENIHGQLADLIAHKWDDLMENRTLIHPVPTEVKKTPIHPLSIGWNSSQF